MRSRYAPVLVAALLLVSVLLFWLPSAAQQDPLPLGTIFTSSLATDIQGLDPAVLTDSASLLVAAQTYETLLNLQPGGTLPQAGLAQSWSSSPDGKVWTFDLQPGVKFHDGTPLDADAVVYNVERWWDPAHPFHQGAFDYFGGLFGGFKGDPDCALVGIAATAPLQIRFTFDRPFDLDSKLTLTSLAIASPTAIRSGTLSSNPVGTGPYKFEQRTPGAEVRLARNPAYWGKQPAFAAISFRVIADETARLAALRSGDVRVAGDFAPQTVAAIDDQELKVLWQPSMNIGYLGINRNRSALGSQLVREAIAHAINRQSLVANFYPLGTQAADQFLPPAMWGYDPTIVDYTYDPALARTLLAQAGYPNGFKTTLSYRPVLRSYLRDPAAVAAAIRAELLQVGIDAEVVEIDSGQFLDKVDKGELDLYLLGWGADYPHPMNFFYGVLCQDTKAFGDRDNVLCGQVFAAQSALFPFGQLSGYRAAARRVHETLPMLPLVHTRPALVVRSDVALLPSPVVDLYRDAFLTDAWQVTPGSKLTATAATGAITTTLEVARGAVNANTLLVYTPQEPTAVPHMPVLAFGGYGFKLDAFQAGHQVSLAPAVPFTLTIDYAGADLSLIDPATVALYRWDGSTWRDDGITIVAHDSARRRLTVAISHLSEFALVGEYRNLLLLPYTAR